ncbi:hypothetical protein BGZ88_011948 [Linnemannia elongata]|nr:hypothetical protein BGZ88_011948 [Linnemannia elongata]
MSQMQRARNLNPSSLESINQPLFLSTDVIEYPQDEGNMLILDHGQHHHQQHHHQQQQHYHHQQHHQEHNLFLTPTVISYNNEEEDDLLYLDGQFMALEIGAPQDWPQDPHQAYQPEEAMVVTEPTSFFADTSGSSSFFADPAGNLYGYQYACSQHLYCHGYEHYGDEHYDSIGDSIHLHDTSMTLADYTNASTSTSTGPKLER